MTYLNLFKLKNYYCELALKMKKFPKTPRAIQTNKAPQKQYHISVPNIKLPPQHTHSKQQSWCHQSLTDTI